MKAKPTDRWTGCVGIAASVLSCLLLAAADAQAQTKKPNILAYGATTSAPPTSARTATGHPLRMPGIASALMQNTNKKA